ncbi:GDSL-type esterase/lipase family protein [Filibacter tadaridae]|uniref:Spore germination lipase LipC n=1 Tax=Filibacter tadaridae TaxID=2483811 RepID=A0A3P5XMJ2_9BACL|nr:GDSL-type esterase/lipase family protein [Filibacter tadaridae]VDC29006.1 Spore germination lipase LipC [Filibacter tadaridae]
MRRMFVFMIAFSLFLTGCSTPLVKNVKPSTEREQLIFSEWEIPEYFIPKKMHVIGLGDSLTQGVGDELKKGGYFGRFTDGMNDWKGIREVTVENLAKRGRKSGQLITQLEKPEIQEEIKNADIIFLTIGGNDIMKIVKANLFELKKLPFYKELGKFEKRLNEVFSIIRGLNGDATIVMAGLYNPLSIVTDEANEFGEIIRDWNKTIEVQTILDVNSCFVPVTDLFDSNQNMVYHTDFFHPNAKGYDAMTQRFMEKLIECGLPGLSYGEMNRQG